MARPAWTIAVALLGACSKSPCEKAAAHYAELYGADLATLNVSQDGIDKFRKQFEREGCRQITSDMACIANAKTLDDTRPCLDKLEALGLEAYEWRMHVEDAVRDTGPVKGPIEPFDKLAARLATLRSLAIPAELPERCPNSITDLLYIDDDILASLAAHQVASRKAVHAGDYAPTILADYVAGDVHDVERLITLRAWVQRAAAPSAGIGIITHVKANPPFLLGDKYLGGSFQGAVVVVDAANRPACRVAITAHSVDEVAYTYRQNQPGEESAAGQAKLDEDWERQLRAMMDRAASTIFGK